MEFMLTKADPQHLNLTATQEVSHRAGNLMTRKIWLPRILYDLLPYFYLTAGFAAFFATLYISEWFWPRICQQIAKPMLLDLHVDLVNDWLPTKHRPNECQQQKNQHAGK